MWYNLFKTLATLKTTPAESTFRFNKLIDSHTFQIIIFNYCCKENEIEKKIYQCTVAVYFPTLSG